MWVSMAFGWKKDPLRTMFKGEFPGGGSTPLYKPYRYVPPHRLGFLRRFGLKTGMVFRGNYGMYERICRFNSKWVRKEE